MALAPFDHFRLEYHMRQLTFIATVAIDLLRSAVGASVKFLGPSWDGPIEKYHPEKHYMRGPGPKWHEKHFLHRASAGS
jgi:hypothetical protein